MCLILLAYKTHPQYPLIIAVNRDESYDRPTAPAAFREDSPSLLAGKDLRSGGTWLGITRNGRIAALANYRGPQEFKANAPSRGLLVSNYLLGDLSAAEYLKKLQTTADLCNGFNMIFGDVRQLYYFSNRGTVPALLSPGIHGQSNHLLDTPWPKVLRGKESLQDILSKQPKPTAEELFALLADRTVPEDRLLPDTGIGLEKERLLAPLFIVSPTYGTRSSTVILINRDGEITFCERTYNGNRDHKTTVEYKFKCNI
jgi:uncharacterized protein with NRDE domain